MSNGVESSVVQAVFDRFNNSSMIQKIEETYGVRDELREIQKDFTANVQAVGDNNGGVAERRDLRLRSYELEDIFETIETSRSTR